jgi:hypothetical protein
LTFQPNPVHSARAKPKDKMPMLSLIPLMVIPFVLYNLIAFGFIEASGATPFNAEVFSMHMMSGGLFSLTLGHLLILISLIFLFFEIIKSSRTSNASVIDHLLSTLVFVAFLVEFLLVKSAATPVFFILMTMAFIDVLAGFSVTIRSAGRDVNFN